MKYLVRPRLTSTAPMAPYLGHPHDAAAVRFQKRTFLRCTGKYERSQVARSPRIRDASFLLSANCHLVTSSSPRLEVATLRTVFKFPLQPCLAPSLLVSRLSQSSSAASIRDDSSTSPLDKSDGYTLAAAAAAATFADSETVPMYSRGTSDENKACSHERHP